MKEPFNEAFLSAEEAGKLAENSKKNKYNNNLKQWIDVCRNAITKMAKEDCYQAYILLESKEQFPEEVGYFLQSKGYAIQWIQGVNNSCELIISW